MAAAIFVTVIVTRETENAVYGECVSNYYRPHTRSDLLRVVSWRVPAAVASMTAGTIEWVRKNKV